MRDLLELEEGPSGSPFFLKLESEPWVHQYDSTHEIEVVQG